MKNPFCVEDFDKAFAPMFSEPVVITLKDGTKQTLSACVFDDATDEPISDASLDTTCERIQLVFKQSDIAFLKAIKRGDVVERSGIEKKYTIQDSRADNTFAWVIRARRA
jgi:hypothetical protein